MKISNRPAPACVTLVAMTTTLVSAVFFDSRHFEYYDTVEVRHLKSDHRSRHARSSGPGAMPDEVHFSLTSRGHETRLRLRRNALSTLNLPVYTLTNGHCIEQKTQGLQSFQGSSFYQDVESAAAIVVTRVTQYLQPFDLEGPLLINGTQFLLTPSQDLLPMHVDARTHILKRVLTTMNFGHDFLDERSLLDKKRRAERADVRRNHRATLHALGKREAPVTHTVELIIIADFEIYNRFFEYSRRNKTEALAQMKLYYVFMTNLMDIRYSSVSTIDPSLIIRVVLLSLVVTDVQQEAVWTERNKLSLDTVDAERALYSFRDWLGTNSNIPRADHWMLFTGYDLAERSGTTTTIGIAFIGTLCTDSAVSVVEEYFTATSGAVSAHELGHSMDADHDGAYKPQCTDDDNHVMSTIATFPREPVKASNPWKFSSCSVDAFGAYLDTVECALRLPQKYLSTSELGGLYLSADEQCQLAMGPGSYFCRTVQVRLGLDLMCRRMYCYLPKEPGFCASVVAQEYTSCDNRKWCQLGLCVFSHDAPQTVEGCPQGDDKAYGCERADCSVKKVREASCCQTCAQRRGITLPVTPPAPTLSPMTSGPDVSTEEPFSSTPASTTSRKDIATTTTTTTTTMKPSAVITLAMSTITAVQTTTTPCTELECQCQRHFSFVCLFLPRG